MNLLIGIFFLFLGLFHALWTISSATRAHKVQWPIRWPVSGRWVLVAYSLSLTFLFFDIFRLRLLYGDSTPNGIWEASIRGFALWMTIWAMWRWLIGNLAITRGNDD
jgi:hypothetical protein